MGRIGPILLICFATVAIVLTINGLFYATSKATMLQMIEGMEREIILNQVNGFDWNSITNWN